MRKLTNFQYPQKLVLLVFFGFISSSCSEGDSQMKSDRLTNPKQLIDESPLIDWVKDPAGFVNSFIGTQGEKNHRHAANVGPGAVLPHGMLNFGPEHVYSLDLLNKSERSKKWVVDERRRMPVSAGGYNYEASRIKGFSLTRLSGTGCLGASGDIPILPFTNAMTHSPDTDYLDAYYSAGYSHDNETASPGFYQVKLDSGVNVELSATLRSGIAKFDFPKAKTAKILVRSSYSQLGSEETITKIDFSKNEIHGFVTSGNFCGYLGEFNRRSYYRLHFVARFDTPFHKSGAWKNEQVIAGARESSGGMGYGDNGVPKLGKGSGVWVEFEAPEVGNNLSQEITVRVGISYVSVENARKNLQEEQASEETFLSIRKKAYRTWNSALEKIRVVDDNDDKLTTFYTALYHSQFHPNVFSRPLKRA